MSRSPSAHGWVLLLVTAAIASSCTRGQQAAEPARTARYEDLISLFTEWRAFQKPRLVEGVPDYTGTAKAAQQRDLPGYQRRLAGIDTTGWTIPQQVDYHVVRAEMNGLDFDHRVLKPWATNPGFYVTVFWDQKRPDLTPFPD